MFKKIHFAASTLLLISIFILCAKQGPQGPAGEKGETDTLYIFNMDTLYIGDTLYVFNMDTLASAPTASFNVTPDSGSIQTTFNVDASGSFDSLQFLLYRWDWESDGTYDTEWSTDKIAAYNFSSTGIKYIVLEVMNIKGLKDTTSKSIVVYNTNPVAYFTINTILGDTNTMFNFDATGCYDLEDNTTMLEVRWDWDNDGVFDEDWSSTKIKTHFYPTFGIKSIRLDVKDLGGLTTSFIKQVTIIEDMTWNCGDTLVDLRDGQRYVTVQMGPQCWMAENLNTGTLINHNQDQTNNSVIEKYAYNDNTTYCDTFGGLYQWDEMMQYSTVEGSQGICPDGWHIPSDDEWKTMEIYLGMSSIDANNTGLRGTDQGSQLKSGGSSGFNALLSGYYYQDTFSGKDTIAHFWNSTECDYLYAWSRTLEVSQAAIEKYFDAHLRDGAFCVRCVRN